MTLPIRSSLLLATMVGLFATACSTKGDDTGTSGDGGGTTGDGGGTTADTGVMVAGYAGQASVTPMTAYDGFEDSYYTGFGPEVDCAITSTLTSSAALTDCSQCDWAFAVDSSDSYLSATTGCDLIGIDTSVAGKYDGNSYNYGYQSDYYVSGYGTYGVLNYYFGGYGWYAVTAADFTGGTFTYDWVSGYYYYNK